MPLLSSRQETWKIQTCGTKQEKSLWCLILHKWSHVAPSSVVWTVDPNGVGRKIDLLSLFVCMLLFPMGGDSVFLMETGRRRYRGACATLLRIEACNGSCTGVGGPMPMHMEPWKQWAAKTSFLIMYSAWAIELWKAHMFAAPLFPMFYPFYNFISRFNEVYHEQSPQNE